MAQPEMFPVFGERLLLWAGLGIAAGLYCFYKGFSLFQRVRLILNAPVSKIRSASTGLVEISGQATGPHLITSPLQGRECYYYRSIAWELRDRGKYGEWVKLAEETSHIPFYLDDGTDKLLIDPQAAEMDLYCDFQEQYGPSIFFDGPEVSGLIRDFLQRHGANLSKQIKVEEYSIKPKNFLFVLGSLSQNPGIDATVVTSRAERSESIGHSCEAMEANEGMNWTRSGDDVRLSDAAQAAELDTWDDSMAEIALPEEPAPPPEIIRLSPAQAPLPLPAMTQQQKLAAALLKAGISTSAAAWTAPVVRPSRPRMPIASASIVATAVESDGNNGSEGDGFDLHPSLVLMKGTHQPAFSISWRSQREVVASLGRTSTLMLWGGPMLILVAVYFLLAHFGRW